MIARQIGTKARRHEGTEGKTNYFFPSCLRACVPSCLFLCIFLSSSGCSSPSAANIELRKQNQQLGEQIDSLKRQHETDQATITGLQGGATTVPSLPQDRLDQLYTTHGLRFGRLTGGANLDSKKRGDEAIRV